VKERKGEKRKKAKEGEGGKSKRERG